MNKAKLFAAAVGSALLPSGPACALPTGETVIHGGVAVSRPAAQTMQIDQSTQKGIVNWQGFSIGSGEHVNISQPGASSVLLNRVVGANPSEIFGRLTANGQVFLTNPNGVLFAPGASVEAGSLFASTLSMTDQDFLNGNYRAGNTGGAGSVINRGRIETPNGYAALAGPRVRNEGVIVARLGTVALAAGDRVSLDMVGDGLINVSVDQAALNASAVNTGTLEANGGRVLMTARSANGLLDTVINTSGVIRANRIAERDGDVVLDAGTAGLVDASGVIEASGTITLNAGAAPGAVIPPGPVLVTPSPLQPGNVIFQEPFAVGSGSNVTLLATGGISLDALNRVALVGATLSVAEQMGSIALLQPSGQAVPPGGYVNVGSTDVGRLAPLQHSIVGTGVTVPADSFLTLK